VGRAKLDRWTKIGHGKSVHIVTVEHTTDGRVTTLCGFRVARVPVKQGETISLCANCSHAIDEINELLGKSIVFGAPQ